MDFENVFVDARALMTMMMSSTSGGGGGTTTTTTNTNNNNAQPRKRDELRELSQTLKKYAGQSGSKCLVENAIGRGTATRLQGIFLVVFSSSSSCYSAKKKKKKKKKKIGGRCFLVSSFASTRDGPRAALTLFFFKYFLFIIFVSSDKIDTSVDAEHRFVLSLRGCADERGDERRRDEKNVVPLHRRVFG